MVKDALGRSWQLGTIQVDYNLPERFDLWYTGNDNEKHRPVMIHRAPFGSMERFIAILLENTAGDFPLWLSPDQFIILPISEKYVDYAKKVSQLLENHDISGLIDDRNEKTGKKIRDAELKKIPFMLVVGENEEQNGTISVRRRGEGRSRQLGVCSPRQTETAVSGKGFRTLCHAERRNAHLLHCQHRQYRWKLRQPRVQCQRRTDRYRL
jgi:threonyl-tRNA synthetase